MPALLTSTNKPGKLSSGVGEEGLPNLHFMGVSRELANKRIQKKWAKGCRRCRKQRTLYNHLCRSCSAQLLRSVYIAGLEYVRNNPGTEFVHVQDSRDRVWTYCGRGIMGGWRYGAGSFREMLLEPWMIWYGKLKFKPYEELDREGEVDAITTNMPNK